MGTIKLEESEILGAVPSHEVEGSGIAVVMLIFNVDEGRVWYDVQEWMDGKLHCATAYSSLKEAFEEYESSVRYYQQQAEYFEESPCTTI